MRSRQNKKRNPRSKSKDQITVLQNVEKCFFDLRERIIYFFRDYSFCYLKLNT